MGSLVELLSRRRIKSLLALLLSVMSSAALAQTTGALNPSPVPAQPSVNEDVPPGGCMPIGLTVSGDIVFPIQCKEFIERRRGAAVEQKPAAVEEKPAAKQSEEVAPEDGKLEINPLKQQSADHKPRQRAMRPHGCRHNPDSTETITDGSGPADKFKSAFSRQVN